MDARNGYTIIKEKDVAMSEKTGGQISKKVMPHNESKYGASEVKGKQMKVIGLIRSNTLGSIFVFCY